MSDSDRELCPTFPQEKQRTGMIIVTEMLLVQKIDRTTRND